MKLLLTLLFLAVAITASEVQPRQITANVDRYVDILLGTVDKWLIAHGMDPMQLADIEKSFSVKPLLITYHGELFLTHGWMQGISSMKRSGEAEMSYEAMLLNIKLPLVFESIVVDFDYSAKIMDLGPTGGVDAKISNLHLYVDITVDTKTLEVTLQDFRITDAGRIDVKFSGHPLLDWLANALTDVVTLLLHSLVQNTIQGEVRGMLERAIDEVNAMRPGQGVDLFPF